jgi:hypothetical protein
VSNHQFTRTPFSSPTTGWAYERAARGQRVSERRQPLPPVVDPVIPASSNFMIDADQTLYLAQHRGHSVVKGAVIGAVAGALVGRAAAKRKQKKSGK